MPPAVAYPVKETLTGGCAVLDRATTGGAGGFANPGTTLEVNMPQNMEITFFRVLKDAKVGDDLAQQAVEALESHIAMKVEEATKSLNVKVSILIAMNAIAISIGGYVAFILANAK